MNLIELKQKRAQNIERMDAILKVETLDDALRAEFDSLESNIDALDKDIKRAEKAEILNIEIATRTFETVDTDDKNIGIIEGLRSYFKTGQAPDEYRGSNGGFILPFDVMSRDDLNLTKLGADNKNKTVANELSVAKSPAESILDKIGVTKYTGLNGDFVVPSMAQVTAGFATEGNAVVDASGAPVSLKLSARRLGAYNVVTKETLHNSNPAIWQGVIQDIRDSWYRAQVADLFDQIQTDAKDASTSVPGTLTYGNVVALEAAVAFDMANPIFVTTPTIAAGLKKTAALTNQAAIWDGPIMDGTIDGIPAISTTLANTNVLLYMDGAAAVVGEWGTGLELLVNPYQYDVEGKIKVTISGLTDTGFKNYRFAKWISDVSI